MLIGNIGNGVLDFIDSTIDLSTANNRTQATVNEAKAAALLSEAERAERAAIAEQRRKDKLADTFTDIVYVMLALFGIGFLVWGILQVNEKTGN